MLNPKKILQKILDDKKELSYASLEPSCAMRKEVVSGRWELGGRYAVSDSFYPTIFLSVKGNKHWVAQSKEFKLDEAEAKNYAENVIDELLDGERLSRKRWDIAKEFKELISVA